MSQFTDAMTAGFKDAQAQIGVSVTLDEETATGTYLPGPDAMLLEQYGMAPQADGVLELFRVDAVKLGLVNRSEIVISGKTMRVIDFVDDARDPCVRYAMQFARKTA